MLKPEFEDRLFLKYLKLLGIQKQRPDIEYLKIIIRAQLSKVPFENISKIFFKKHLNLSHLIDFETYLNGIEKYGFGGTCYSNNFYLNQLLNWLGYDVKLCGADMKNPAVHIINIVNIKNHKYLVDVGYAAPFTEPLPLDLSEDYILNIGNDQYILKPQKTNEQSEIKLFRDGEQIHGYRINRTARTIDEFNEVIEKSFEEGATFMNALLLTRFEHNTYTLIHNRTIIESIGTASKVYFATSNDQLAWEINHRFSIPQKIITECLDKLQMKKNAWN